MARRPPQARHSPVSEPTSWRSGCGVRPEAAPKTFRCSRGGRQESLPRAPLPAAPCACQGGAWRRCLGFLQQWDSPSASSCSQPSSEATHRSCQWGTKNANCIHRARPSLFIIYACPKVLLFRLYSKAILLMICLMFSLYTVVLIHSCQRNMSFLIHFKGNKPQRLVKCP